MNVLTGKPNRRNGPRPMSLAERLWKHVDKSGECWLWKGGLNQEGGYGSIGLGRTRVYVHRLSWELANGRPVPKGLDVMHACDVKTCVRPEHLAIGSRSRNIRDANLRGLMKSNKLTPQDVADIKDAAMRFVRRLAKSYSIHEQYVLEIIGGKAWRSLHATPGESSN